jgi:hypothetical protein
MRLAAGGSRGGDHLLPEGCDGDGASATASTASEHAPTVRFSPVTTDVIPMAWLFPSGRAFGCTHTFAVSRFCARSRRSKRRFARASPPDGLIPSRSAPWVRCRSVVTFGHATLGIRGLARAPGAGIYPRLTGPSVAQRSNQRTSSCPGDDERRTIKRVRSPWLLSCLHMLCRGCSPKNSVTS